MNKEFIPYKQALELKELGFDEPCLSYYDKEEKLCRSLLEYPIINSKNGFHHSHSIITAPLYQQAFRWFREKYKLDITIQHGKKYIAVVYSQIVNESIDEYDTYEEAELACIVKLIEIIKNK